MFASRELGMSKSDTWKNWEGRTVDGRFPLRQWLGNSEHSSVFLTDRPGQNGQKAAIKFVELNGADPEREAARLRAAASLSHPKSICIFANGTLPCRRLAVPLCRHGICGGRSRADSSTTRIDANRSWRFASPLVLDALSYIHEKGFVHGHIKPSNVQAVQDQLKLSSDQVLSAAETNGGAQAHWRF